MPPRPAPTPIQEISLHEFFMAVDTRLAAFGENPDALRGREHVKHGLHVWDKGLRKVYDQLIANPDQPKSNQLDLEKSVRQRKQTLRNALVANKHDKDVAETEAQHNGLMPVTRALLELAKKFPSPGVTGAAAELQPDFDALEALEQRNAQSGHDTFDAATVKLLREAWAELDNGYDCLGICLRSAGQSYDPVLAARPELHSTVRIELRKTPEGQPAHPAHPRKANKDKNEKGQDGAGKDAKDSAAKKDGASEGEQPKA